MSKASQAENKRDSDSIINRLTYHQNIRISEHQTFRETMKQISALQRADRQHRSRKQRKAIQKIHRKIPKKILPKFEELLRTYRKNHIENPKKFCQKLRSMRFLPISLPSLLYVDSSPQGSISPFASETPGGV